VFSSGVLHGPDPTARRPTIGRQLAEVRLLHRQRRVEQVMRELRVRAAVHSARGETVPKPLSQALQEFATELSDVRRALADNGSPARRTGRRGGSAIS
jgi:hypothetical protein